MSTGKDIPPEVALKLCDEIQAEHKQRRWFSWFSIWRLNCWGCYKWAKGDVEKLCLSSEGGCAQVNNRYKLHQEHK